MRFKGLFIQLLIVVFCFNQNAVKAIYVIDTSKKHEVNNQFIGKWTVKTIVTQSNCPYIIVGSTSISKIEIKKDTNKLIGHWQGGNWSSTQFTIDQLSNEEAISKRVTENSVEDATWKAILTDHIYIGDDERIRLDSSARQYKNGSFVGEYKTYSILSKN